MNKTLSNITYIYGVRACHAEFGYCRAVDLSRHIKITPGSCSTGIKILIKKGLVDEDPNKFLKLSKEAEGILNKLDKKHEAFDEFLFSHTTLPFDEVHDLTKQFIHLVPQEVIDAI